jgi:hypothetical protein
LDGQRIIIFGGDANLDLSGVPLGESLYELNLISFEWYIPKVSGKIPSSRIFHKANLIGKYMVVSFGNYNMIIIYNNLDNDLTKCFVLRTRLCSSKRK